MPQEKNICKAWPLSMQEAINILLRIYFAPILFSNRSLFPRAHGRAAMSSGNWNVLQGPTFQGLQNGICKGLSCVLGAQHLVTQKFSAGLRTSLKLLRHRPRVPRHPSSLQCYRILRWAFKEMDPVLPSLFIAHRDGKPCRRQFI